MVVYYQIAGMKLGSHVLAMATLGSMFAGSYIALSGGDKTKKKEQGPPIVASSKDEENFIQDFLKNVDAGEKQAKH